MQKQRKKWNGVFRRLAATMRTNKDSIEKQKKEKVWHRIIEGGILVRIREGKNSFLFSRPMVSVAVLGDMGVYSVNETIFEAQQATAYLRKKTGRADWILDVEEDGKILSFIYRPLLYETTRSLSEKYDEMLNVMVSWNKGVESFGMADLSVLSITSLKEVIAQIDSHTTSSQ